MKKIKEVVNKNLSGKKVLLLFVLTNLIYAIMLIVTIPKTMIFSKGMRLLDMMPLGYDSAYVNALFETLGVTGRAVYLYNQIPVDMIYPFLFGISYCLLIAYFLKKLNKLNSTLFYFILLMFSANNCWNSRLFREFWNYQYVDQLSQYITNFN